MRTEEEGEVGIKPAMTGHSNNLRKADRADSTIDPTVVEMLEEAEEVVVGVRGVEEISLVSVVVVGLDEVVVEEYFRVNSPLFCLVFVLLQLGLDLCNTLRERRGREKAQRGIVAMR